MKRTYCDACKKVVKYTIKEKLIKEFKGFEVNVIEKIGVCNVCSNHIYIPELETQNFKKLYDKYREMAEIVSSKQIIQFREKYSISQRELTAVLNWGKMTINRYERGAVPSASHNDVLKHLISNESIFREKVEEAFNGGRISDKTFYKISEEIKTKTNNAYQELIIESLTHTKDEYNGFRIFDIERVINLISFIADKTELYKTSLNKYLWYIDFLNFKAHTRSITGLRYMKYKYGPVIEKFAYESILHNFDEKFEKDEYFDGDSIKTKIISKKNYDMSIFKDEEFKIINMVIDGFKNMKGKDITELSHQEDAWLFGDNRELISYEYADKLKVELQEY